MAKFAFVNLSKFFDFSGSWNRRNPLIRTLSTEDKVGWKIARWVWSTLYVIWHTYIYIYVYYVCYGIAEPVIWPAIRLPFAFVKPVVNQARYIDSDRLRNGNGSFIFERADRSE